MPGCAVRNKFVWTTHDKYHSRLHCAKFFFPVPLLCEMSNGYYSKVYIGFRRLCICSGPKQSFRPTKAVADSSWLKSHADCTTLITGQQGVLHRRLIIIMTNLELLLTSLGSRPTRLPRQGQRLLLGRYYVTTNYNYPFPQGEATGNNKTGCRTLCPWNARHVFSVFHSNRHFLSPLQLLWAQSVNTAAYAVAPWWPVSVASCMLMNEK